MAAKNPEPSARAASLPPLPGSPPPPTVIGAARPGPVIIACDGPFAQAGDGMAATMAAAATVRIVFVVSLIARPPHMLLDATLYTGGDGWVPQARPRHHGQCSTSPVSVALSPAGRWPIRSRIGAGRSASRPPPGRGSALHLKPQQLADAANAGVLAGHVEDAGAGQRHPARVLHPGTGQHGSLPVLLDPDQGAVLVGVEWVGLRRLQHDQPALLVE